MRLGLSAGDSVSFSKTITETDLVLFAGITGDFDPIHVDEAYARTTPLGRRIAHGALVLGLCSTVAAMIARRAREGGAEGVALSLGYDRVRFTAPVYPGETLTATYTVGTVDEAAARTVSPVEVRKEDGTLALAATHVMTWVRG
ncbi:MaoC family dehydratase [Elioraea sp.]|uniref:MaoC family dehydratase n=1 Tax=Elioraea sp. TaxID=2185103 RepID=UPI0021DD90DA|nr:MaoC family dehydratase [Elioraea sp.]GIX11424.1 MAG: dehydratase [Elioraea sp.]